MSCLIQLLLPLYDNQGQRQPRELFEQTQAELMDRFGGLSSYARAPISGLWAPAPGQVKHDDLVTYEIMAPQLDANWWRDYRQVLEQRFVQQSIVVRAIETTLL